MRIRVGEGWKHDPQVLAGLRALGEGRGRGFSPRAVVAPLAFEADGVDLAAGRAEVPLFEALGALVRAAHALPRASAPVELQLPGCEVTVTLVRDGEEATVRLSAPELPAREAQVEVRVFVRAVRAAVQGFLDELAKISTGLSEVRAVRELVRDLAAAIPKRAQVSRALAAPSFGAKAPLGDYLLAVRTDRPALCLLGRGDDVCWTTPRSPVAALLELARLAAGGADAERRSGTIALGRADSLSLAQLRAAVLALAPAVLDKATARDRRALEEACALLQEAAPGPAVVRPLPPSPAPRRRAPIKAPQVPATGLRRLLLRPAWRVDAPGARPRLLRCGPHLLVRAGAHAEVRTAQGERLWAASVSDAQPIDVAGVPRVVARDSHGALLVLDALRGTRLARAPAAVHGHLREAYGLADGSVAAHDGTRLVGLHPSHPGSFWTFDPGPERSCVAAALAHGAVVGTDRGDLYGVEADGTVAWRCQPGLDLIEAVRIDPPSALAIATGLDPSGNVGVVAVRLSDGTCAWSTALHGVRPGEPVIARGRILLGFDTAAGPTLACLDVGTGRLRWSTIPPDDGAVVPVLGDDRIYVTRLAGGLVCYSLAGALQFQQPPRDPDPALSPVRPRRPVVGGGLVVVAAALVHVFDAQNGRLVASLEPAELAPEALAVLDGPIVVAASRDGLVEAWRAAGHLRVVEAPVD